MRLLALVFGVALLAGSSSMAAADQQPMPSIPRGSEKAIEKTILWLQQQQKPRKGPVSNTERTLEAIQKAASAQRLSHTERAVRAFQIIAAVGAGGNWLLVPTRAADGPDAPNQAQPEIPQTQTDRPIKAQRGKRQQKQAPFKIDAVPFDREAVERFAG